MKTNKILFLIVIALVVSLVVYSVFSQRKDTEDIAKVAVILNLSGENSKFDAVKKNSVHIAMGRIDSLFPNAKIEVKFFDANSNPATTKAAVQSALDWGADFFLSGTSPTALAIADQIRNIYPIKVHFANAANPKFGPPIPGEYRMWPDWKQEAELIAKQIKDNKINSVLLIYSTDPYSQSLAEDFKKLALESKIYTQEFTYDPMSSPDFRPSVLKAKTDNLQSIVIFGLPTGLSILIGQLSETNWENSVIGGVNINLNLTDVKSSNLKGQVWSVRTEAMNDSGMSDGEPKLYKDAYFEKYKNFPPFHSLYIADALYLIANVVSIEGEYPYLEKIQQIKQFNSASGEIILSPEGVLLYDLKTELIYDNSISTVGVK